MSEQTGQKHTDDPEQLVLFAEKEISHKEETRLCGKCKQWLPLDFFNFASGGNYLRRECKPCNNKLHKVREELKSIHKAPSKGYSCPICLGTEEDVEGLGGKNQGSWVLDHCHETQSFRGWLCHKCNRGLGAFDDNKQTLKRAIEYLG